MPLSSRYKGESWEASTSACNCLSFSSLFFQRSRFTSNCLVVQWSGDNSNSLAGFP